MGYYQLLLKHPRSIGFGFLNSFFSGLGQTHFISLLSPLIIAQYSLTNTQYGSLYSIITLISGIFISFIGPMIDRFDARHIGVSLGVGLFLSQILVSSGNTLMVVALGIFGLRLFGQGLCSSLSSITVARYFDEQRGQALSLSQLGFPFYEGVITPLGAVVIANWGYPILTWFLGAALILIFIPLSFWLTRPLPHFNFVSNGGVDAEPTRKQKSGWTRRQMLNNRTVYALVPQLLMPPFALTGIFFHQAVIGAQKGWSLKLMASGLFFFAIGRIINTFITGPFVDRHSAIKLFPWYQLPFAFGFLLLSLSHQVWAPAVAFSLFGLTVGGGGPIKSAIWAELYGVRHLGAIKSLFATIMVFSTAASPALFGWIIDRAQSPNGLLMGLFVTSLFSALLAGWGLKRHSYQ